MKVFDFKELTVWQKSMNLVVEVYEATRRFPRHEAYGLTGQLRRAVVSVPSNIAEGHGRRSPREFRKFLSIAYGSLKEVETQLMIAQRLNYLESTSSAKLLRRAAEVGRLLNGLSRSIEVTPRRHSLRLTTDN